MKKCEYTIYSDKINNDKNIAIVADMHIDDLNKRKIDTVLSVLDEINPTHIVLPGDLCNENVDTAIKFINSICEIADSFFVRGDIDTKLLYEINDSRFHVLNNYNNFISINDIDFLGIKLSHNYYKLDERQKVLELITEYKNLLKKISLLGSNDNFRVLLCHDPIIMDAINILNSEIFNLGLNLDLVISCHNHGGMYPEFLKPILERLKYNVHNLYPKYVKGMINNNDISLIISEGITKYKSFIEIFHEGTVENVRILKK